MSDEIAFQYNGELVKGPWPFSSFFEKVESVLEEKDLPVSRKAVSIDGKIDITRWYGFGKNNEFGDSHVFSEDSLHTPPNRLGLGEDRLISEEALSKFRDHRNAFPDEESSYSPVLIRTTQGRIMLPKKSRTSHSFHPSEVIWLYGESKEGDRELQGHYIAPGIILDALREHKNLEQEMKIEFPEYEGIGIRIVRSFEIADPQKEPYLEFSIGDSTHQGAAAEIAKELNEEYNPAYRCGDNLIKLNHLGKSFLTEQKAVEVIKKVIDFGYKLNNDTQ